jgi:hypothetical protein
LKECVPKGKTHTFLWETGKDLEITLWSLESSIHQKNKGNSKTITYPSALKSSYNPINLRNLTQTIAASVAYEADMRQNN